MANELFDESVRKKLENASYTKGTVLIQSKSGAAIFEHKLDAIALSRIDEAIDVEGDPLVVIPAKEIQVLLGTKGKSLYKRLDDTAKVMVGRTFGYSNPKEKKFMYAPLYHKVEYENGDFKIQFNREIKPFIKALGDPSGYTRYSLPIVLNFDSKSTYVIYERLRQVCYYTKGKEGDGVFHLNYDINEFKLDTGCIDVEEPAVKTILNQSKNPDFEKAVNAAKKQKYARFCDLEKRVLIPAVEEINEKSDIFIKYEPITKGTGNRKIGIAFEIILKSYVNLDTIDIPDAVEIVEEIVEEKVEISEDEKIIIYDYINTEVGLKFSECLKIAELANYNMERLKKAVEVLKGQKTPIENKFTYMIWALNSNAEPNKKKEKESSFSGYYQKNYAYPEIFDAEMRLDLKQEEQRKELVEIYLTNNFDKVTWKREALLQYYHDYKISSDEWTIAPSKEEKTAYGLYGL